MWRKSFGCVQLRSRMRLSNTCAFLIVTAGCCNCKMNPYLTLQLVPALVGYCLGLWTLGKGKSAFLPDVVGNPDLFCSFSLYGRTESVIFCLLILGQLREQLSYLKGDNFFRFTCSDCSEDGKEQFERLRLTWQQVSTVSVPGEGQQHLRELLFVMYVLPRKGGLGTDDKHMSELQKLISRGLPAD